VSLSSEQLSKLQSLLAQERAVSGDLPGDRFEKILCSILPDCTRSVVNTRDKQWFDLAQPHRGIEAKTFQIAGDEVRPGTTVSNVLKRVAPNLLPAEVTKGEGKERQVDRSIDPSAVGAAILEYLRESMVEHARAKGISGEFVFAILFRNSSFTQVGYWEEPIDFGRASDYVWEWRGRSLKGERSGVEQFTWYWAGGRQLFYRFEAPENVQVFDIPEIKGRFVSEAEMRRLLDAAYLRGMKDVQGPQPSKGLKEE
jgi:hypothetical protein